MLLHAPTTPIYLDARRLSGLGITPMRKRIGVCLVFGAIGFSPIATLALTVGGLWSLSIGSLVLIVPAILVGIVLGLTCRRYGRSAVDGLTAGLIAVLVYDLVRWTFVALGLWGDFIPNIGGWLDGTGQPNWILGYAFRWLGDGGGMGVAFMVAARELLPRLPARASMGVGVAYGMVIWLCLVMTLVLSADGQAMLFQLTPVTVLLSWTGHVVYGGVLGASLARTVATQGHR